MLNSLVRRVVAAVAAAGLAAAGASVVVAQEAAPVDYFSPTAPAVAGDGSRAVFGATLADGRQTVMLTDLAGSVRELSPIPRGVRSGDTIRPAISADGCIVVAITEVAFDLFRDDDQNERWDVYRLQLPGCGGTENAWELVSSGVDGTATDNVLPYDAPAISGVGTTVAYIEQDPAVDDELGRLTLVDLTVAEGQPGRRSSGPGRPQEDPNRRYQYRGASGPAISENGRHIAFTADYSASALLPGWNAGPADGAPGKTQVYLWDRQPADGLPPVSLVSGHDNIESPVAADSATISADGRFVAFVSADRNLVPSVQPRCQPDCATQVYRLDRDPDRNGVFDENRRRDDLVLVSATTPAVDEIGLPVAGNDSSWAPAMSADGSEIAFVSAATNLTVTTRSAGGNARDDDLLLAEVQLGRIRRVLADLPAVPGAHSAPTLSRSAQTIVFETAVGATLPAANLITRVGDRSLAVAELTPQLSIAQVDFGSVRPTFRSDEYYVTVQNGGPGAFEPETITVGSAFSVSGGTCQQGIVVAAGESCTVNLVFEPGAATAYSSTLSVSGLNGDQATTTVHGVGGEPTLTVDPGGADIGRGVVGADAGRVAFGFRNIGFVPVQMGTVSVAGNHPDDFIIDEEVCTDRALNPQASCAVEVRFRPTGSGFRSALIRVATSDGTYTTAIVGGFAFFEPTITVGRGEVAPAASVTVTGAGFPATAEVSIELEGGVALSTITTDDAGAFSAAVVMPQRIRAGTHQIVAAANGANGSAVAVGALTITPPDDPATPLPGYGLG